MNWRIEWLDGKVKCYEGELSIRDFVLSIHKCRNTYGFGGELVVSIPTTSLREWRPSNVQ